MAEKCYSRPQRESLPQWPCEDESTARKLCCLSATIYDVRCWGVQGDRDRYVDYSPGDIIGQRGTRAGAQYTINCDPEDQYTNTNLRGSVAFMFPDPDVNPDGFDLQDAVNPWLPCPCIQTELQDSGLYYTTLKTWVGVSWSYSCDTGLVSFRAVWGGWAGNDIYPWQEYYKLVNQLAGKEAVTTADPDWYLDNEITIPYATENDTNRLSRFSVKLKMTCEAEEPEECEPTDCLPVCVVRSCPVSGDQKRPVYLTVSGCADLAALAPATLDVDASGFSTPAFGYGPTSPPGEPPVANIKIEYLCQTFLDEGITIVAFVRRVTVTDTDAGEYILTEPVDLPLCDASGTFHDTFQLTLVDCSLVTFDVFSDGSDTWEPL